jgi:hypothetical protein
MSLIRCNISIAIADGSVLVSVRVPRETPTRDIDAIIEAVIGTFAAVEDDCPNEQPAPEADAFGFFLERKYSDPGYPDRLTSALREMAHSSDTVPSSATLH